MSAREPVHIAGVYEHPTREAHDKSSEQLHAESAKGALADAGLAKTDIDGLATVGAGEPPQVTLNAPNVLADYMGFTDLAFLDSTDTGGSAHLSHIGHAASAIRDGKCDAVLVTFGSRDRTAEQKGTSVHAPEYTQQNFESIYGHGIGDFALAATRHMHEFGTTSEQLAEIRVAASHHAQYNEHALYPDPVTIEDVVSSRMIADPLHLLDCCVVSDGGAAIIVVSDELRQELDRECVEVLGHGEGVKHHDAGRVDPTYTAARFSGPRAFAEAGVGPEDIEYASLYDAFTILVLETLEDLGFCEKGKGGEFVEDGALKSPDGRLPFNTDGGGQCSWHPGRGGMTKVIEAVNQLRGEANPEVQVDDPELVLAHAFGGNMTIRHATVTLVLGRGR